MLGRDSWMKLDRKRNRAVFAVPSAAISSVAPVSAASASVLATLTSPAPMLIIPALIPVTPRSVSPAFLSAASVGKTHQREERPYAGSQTRRVVETKFRRYGRWTKSSLFHSQKKHKKEIQSLCYVARFRSKTDACKSHSRSCRLSISTA